MITFHEALSVMKCRRWRSNPSGKCSQERLTPGTVTSTMRRVALPSECAMCGAGASCSAIRKPSLKQKTKTCRVENPRTGARGQEVTNLSSAHLSFAEKAVTTCQPPTIRVGSNRAFQVLDLYWRSPESGSVWHKSMKSKETI